MLHQGKDNHDDCHQSHRQTQESDKLQWCHGERSDAIDTETQHLGKRILALACLACLAVVIDKSLTETQLSDDGPEEEVALRILHQCLEGTVGHHSEVSMILHRILVHTLHQFIEGKSCESLEERIGLTFLSYTIDNILSFLYLTHHIHNHILVVLQVGINTNHCITMIYRSLHTSPKGILVSTIMG